MKCKIGGQTVELEIDERINGGAKHARGHRVTTLPVMAGAAVQSGTVAKPHINVTAKSFTFTLSGQIRGGKNNMKIGRNGKHYPDKTFAKWRDEAVNDIYQHSVIFHRPTILEIEVHYAASDLRRRDIPGMLDALFHVLERARIVEDDAQIQEALWYQLPTDREHPSVRVTVKERKA